MADSIIRFENISKNFAATAALRDVSFEIERGEVHCLCGENGAGKSTLINICGGVFSPTHGKIFIDGKETEINSITKSEEMGFFIVHQEVPLCANMSIAHNIFLGYKSPDIRKSFFLDEKFMRNETQKMLDLFKLQLKPDQLVETLSIAEQSIIQIAKAIYFKPRIMIMDEPTAALTNDQRKVVFDIIHQLKTNGTTIIYVSHRLEEIIEIGDSITVLRDGQFICTKRVCEVTQDDLVKLMVGREIDMYSTHESQAQDEVLLEVKELTRKGEFENISFQLKKGEILGIAGFIGAGRTEVLMSLFGATKPYHGEIRIHGELIKIKNVETAIKNRIALIPESRRDDAIIPSMSIKDNAQLVTIAHMMKGPFIDKKKTNKCIEQTRKKFSIKANDCNLPIMTLSGGNQQKVVAARWIDNDPEILLCDEPTRGIDVGAKSEIYDIIREVSKDGVGTIVVSSELPELISLCDRIIVMHEGKLTGELHRNEFSEELIMGYATKTNC
ncbi:sugar ABC transporter ATP-binding protein [Christensenella tenuis]|uniref:Sugar ABC transporter ATP-binding protein n=1 Tax=Christensenella tenuis TaxID=2763033 RepID=A0ABR7EDD0_9FIRM|nr:sugar ABC transporter ATP-binding protein [Christensenella tenuis]MBC5647792.1 sugar ABC transporter ATP-binding protein [Christensenella tenuis]